MTDTKKLAEEVIDELKDWKKTSFFDNVIQRCIDEGDSKSQKYYQEWADVYAKKSIELTSKKLGANK